MKAILLSAGLGTRLRPLTDDQPKCLLTIDDKPLLYHWLDLLESENISDVLINTHYLAGKVQESVKRRKNKIGITLVYEPQLLGSAGTIFANKHFFENDNDFLLLYSDNLTDVSLTGIIDFHKSVDSVFTTFIYETDKPTEKGIFEYDLHTGKVISFEEKPLCPRTNYANAGIGVLNREIFNYDLHFPDIPLDFGKSVMPLITDKMYVLKTDKCIIDIGSVEDYKTAQEIWKKHIKKRT
ncbi:MAG TPA: nucleotidyltransferase family protein [Bacteroidales bacterium]|nr:nucleotidyltransferase family protein [Bacteroidales bacterium]